MTRAFLAVGRLVATPGARALGVDLFSYLARHTAGDWGDLDPHNWVANDRASLSGLPVMSAYRLDKGGYLWVITEGDRLTTTFLIPTEHRTLDAASERRLRRA